MNITNSNVVIKESKPRVMRQLSCAWLAPEQAALAEQLKAIRRLMGKFVIKKNGQNCENICSGYVERCRRKMVPRDDQPDPGVAASSRYHAMIFSRIVVLAS
jgi:hypothetical protein